MKTLVAAVMAACLTGSLAYGQVVVIDDVFGDGNPEANTDGIVAPGVDGSYYVLSADGGVETTGNIPEVTEPGPLKFDPSANGNWARAELLSNNDFAFPTTGASRTLSWTIGPVNPTQISDTYRIQFTAINAARTQDTAGNGIGRGSERWLVDGDNGESAISLDLFFSEDNVFNEIGTLTGQLWEKDSTFPSANNGIQLDTTGNGGDLNFQIGEEFLSEWRFWEDPNTFSLTMTDTGYTWSDSVTGFEFSRDYPAQTEADFADGYWAFTMGQNPNTGRGNHELSRFMVTETGGGGGVTGDFDGDGNWDCADIDSLVAEIANGGSDLSFDMNGDGTVDAADITDGATGWLAVGGANNPSATNGGNAFLSGDGNLDGSVDVTDFNIWNASKFTTTPAWCSGDFNADGSVDVGDFNVWNGNKFQSSDIAAVPEPGSMVLLLTGLLLLPLRNRRQNRG